MQRRTAALRCLLVLLAAHNAMALPAYWTDPIGNPYPTGPKTTPACTAHPAEAHGDHPPPRPDTTIAFKLTSGATAVKSVCPGRSYTLTTTWAIGGFCMITTTVGTLASPEAVGGDRCKNRVVFEAFPTGASGSTYTSTLAMPATAPGASIVLQATCAAGSPDHFHQASATIPIAATGCTATTATPARNATTTTPAGNATAPTAATPTATPTGDDDDDDSEGDDDSKGRGRGRGSDDDGGDDDDTPSPAGTPAAGTPTNAPATPGTPTATPTATGTARGTPTSSALSAEVTAFTSPMCKQPVQTDGGACTKSPLGYSCTHSAGALTTHWTIGGCPPSNACTKTYTVRNKALPADQQYLHYAATYKTTGYVSVGFARSPGSMAGTDAVIGWVNPSDGSPNVEAYYVPDSDTVSARNKYSSDQNWMVLSGASVTADGETTICFSRPITADSSRILKTVPTTTPVGMNWAVGRNNQRALTEHTIASGYQFNPVSGATTSQSGDDKFYTYHGILMALAWVVLAPLGVLFARHRWALGDFKLGKVHFWFHAHRAIQMLAIGLFVGGMVIAFTKLGAPSGGIGKAHSLLAWVMIALAGLQFLAAFIRPPADSPNRRYWNLFHWNLGRLTLATGIINTFLGIVVYDRETGKSVTLWFAVLGGAMAAWVVAEVVLSLMSLKKGAAEAAAPPAKDVDELEVARLGQGAASGQRVQPPMYPQHSANVV